MGITSVPNPFSVDITEIDGFDNLHHAEDIFERVDEFGGCGVRSRPELVSGEWQYVRDFGGDRGGGEAGGKNPHGSKFPQIGVSRGDFKPTGTGIFISEEVPEFQIPGGIEPEQVERALLEHPEIRAVFVTSPTYEGIVSDIQGLQRRRTGMERR